MYSINYILIIRYKLCKMFLYFVGLQAVIEIIDLKMNSVMKIITSHFLFSALIYLRTHK